MLFLCYPKCSTCQKAKKISGRASDFLYGKKYKRRESHGGRAENLDKSQRASGEKIFQHQRDVV